MIIHAVEPSGNLKKMKYIHVTTRENLGNLELARPGGTPQHLGAGTDRQTDRWLLGVCWPLSVSTSSSVNRLCLQKNRVKSNGEVWRWLGS